MTHNYDTCFSENTHFRCKSLHDTYFFPYLGYNYNQTESCSVICFVEMGHHFVGCKTVYLFKMQIEKNVHYNSNKNLTNNIKFTICALRHKGFFCNIPASIKVKNEEVNILKV